MNKIASLKPGDDGVLIEALINHVVSGKTNGAHLLNVFIYDITR